MKSTQLKLTSTVVVIALAFLSLIAVVIGIYGLFILVGEISDDMSATRQRQATNEAKAFSLEVTTTAEAVTAVTATEEAKWSRFFFDSFDAYYKGDWPGGEVDDSFATVNTYIENGKYNVEVAAKKYVNRRVWSDKRIGSVYILEVDVQKTSGLTSDAYGLAFGRDNFNFYVFLIDDIPQYWVSVMRSGGWHSVIQPYRTDVINPREVNTLKVISEGNRLFFYINDQLVGESQDYLYESTKVGLCVELNALHEAVYVFDNLSLFTPQD